MPLIVIESSNDCEWKTLNFVASSSKHFWKQRVYKSQDVHTDKVGLY